MAKGDKTDVAKAKDAAAKRRYKNPRAGIHSGGLTTKETNAERKNMAKKGYSQPKVTKGTDGFKMIGKSISATKPSMPVKTGVKNKVKAQGAKSMGAPTSGYGKTTKKK